MHRYGYALSDKLMGLIGYGLAIMNNDSVEDEGSECC